MNPDNPIGPTDPNYPPATGGTSVQLGLTLKGTSYCQCYAKPVKVSGSSAPQLTLQLSSAGASLRSGYETIEITVEQVARSAKVIDFIAYSNRERGVISLQGTLNVDKKGQIKTGKAVMLQSQVISSCFENYQVKLKAQ